MYHSLPEQEVAALKSFAVQERHDAAKLQVCSAAVTMHPSVCLSVCLYLSGCKLLLFQACAFGLCFMSTAPACAAETNFVALHAACQHSGS